MVVAVFTLKGVVVVVFLLFLVMEELALKLQLCKSNGKNPYIPNFSIIEGFSHLCCAV